jgi:hypothetical protein
MEVEMKRKSLIAVVAATLTLFAGAACAMTIYDESIDGDLDAIGSTNVDLVAGVNQILGTINQTPPSETDRIRFTQVANLTVDSIVLSFALPFDNENIGQSMTADLHNDVANLFDDNFNNVNSGANISASFFDSFGPETGPLSQTTFGAIWDFQLSAGTVFPGQPWTLTITTSGEVAPVPLPAAAPLLALVLGGLAMVRRRSAA